MKDQYTVNHLGSRILQEDDAILLIAWVFIEGWEWKYVDLSDRKKKR